MKRKRRDANVTEETLPAAVSSGENASAPTITGAPEPPSKPIELPSTADLERELEREQGRTRMRRIVRGTFFVLIAVAAVAVLVATLFLPVLVVHGSSMTPTLHDGEMVVSVRSSAYQQGDVIAFYYNNSILVKRVIATSGQWVDINEDGVVRVDGQVLDEPYVDQLALGTCDIELPYQVPEGRIFVMGDHRTTSIDSRTSEIGCIDEDDVVGDIVFRFWPLDNFGLV